MAAFKQFELCGSRMAGGNHVTAIILQVVLAVVVIVVVVVLVFVVVVVGVSIVRGSINGTTV